jgi:GNAT superfamily N-acetyltransferase
MRGAVLHDAVLAEGSADSRLLGIQAVDRGSSFTYCNVTLGLRFQLGASVSGRRHELRGTEADPSISARPHQSDSTRETHFSVEFIEILPVRPEDDLMNGIIKLADSASRTLGFLPPPVFIEAARRQTLLAALSRGRLAGYALYDLPRQHIRLVHLCVAVELRGHSVARLLIEEISKRHHDRLGIILRCRRDYPAHHMWPRLGFQPRNELRGRGRQPTELVVWWRDHGHPDLFSSIETTALLRAAIDFGVLSDLHRSKTHTSNTESDVLNQDWLAGKLELVVTSEIYREIDRLQDSTERHNRRTVAYKYAQLRVDVARSQVMASSLRRHVLENHRLDLAGDPSNLAAISHIAEASVDGIPVLVTHNDGLVKRLSEAAMDVCGVRILRPTDVAVRIDELMRAQEYRPADLLNTEYTISSAAPGGEHELITTFTNTPGNELPSQLSNRLRQLAGAAPEWNRKLIRDPVGTPTALYVYGEKSGEIVVPVLRVRSFNIGDTIIRQLLLALRQECRNRGTDILRLSDPHLSQSVRSAALDDGFQSDGRDLIALVINSCADSSVINRQLASINARTTSELPQLEPHPPAVAAAALERVLWPVKIIDAELPTFLIPIRPEWASMLFDTPRTLFPRSALLGISREHIYYRSPSPRVETAPARVLWYASGAQRKPYGIGAVIASSRLEEVIIDEPDALHARFRHLGVWQRHQVEKAAHRGLALALRFFDTEVFPYPVPLQRLRGHAQRVGVRLVLRAPQRVPAELFARVYLEGWSRS